MSEEYKQDLKYGLFPAKEAESISWDLLLLDLIEPYRIIREGHDDPLILKSITMVDPMTGWYEIVWYNNKKVATT